MNYVAVRSGNKWAVFNKETRKSHSTWSSQREASQAAADLNRYLKRVEFNTRLEKFNSLAIRK